jgi:hypothetical protein
VRVDIGLAKLANQIARLDPNFILVHRFFSSYATKLLISDYLVRPQAGHSVKEVLTARVGCKVNYHAWA